MKFVPITRGVMARIALAGVLALTPSLAMADVLNVMQSEAPRSMDPGDQSATFTNALLRPMFEGLTDRDTNQQIVPKLATEWTSDEAGLVWTFKLREGVVFHDGTPFNAEAAAYNFNRHLDTARGLAASGRLRTFMQSVRAVDEYTLEITLKSPYPAFLALLSTQAGWQVSPAADAAGNLGSASVGTGPYRLAENRSGEYVLQEKFADYWGDKAAGEDQIRWTWSAETSVLNMALQTGDADVINPVPAAFARQIEGNPELKLNVSDGSAVFWVALNTEAEPLNDVRVRQALNFATDKNGLVQAIMAGYASPANSPLASITPGFDASLNPYPLDMERAKSLLAEAGVADGFEVNVVVQEPEARIGEVLQAMWAPLGVTVNVQRMESGVWSQAAFGDPAQKAEQNVDAVIASWSSGVNGADLQLRPLYHSSSFSPGSANLGFFKNEEFDALLDKAAATNDEAERNAIYVEAQKLINDEAPHVLLYVNQDLYATRQGVSGAWMVPGGFVRVESATKQ